MTHRLYWYTLHTYGEVKPKGRNVFHVNNENIATQIIGKPLLIYNIPTLFYIAYMGFWETRKISMLS